MADKTEVKRLLNMIRLGRRILHPRKSPQWPEAQRLATPEEIHRYRQHGERVLVAIYGSDSEAVRRFSQESARAFRVVSVEPPDYEAETVEVVDRDALEKSLDVLRGSYRQATKAQRNPAPAMPPLPEPPAAFAAPRGQHIWGLMKTEKCPTELELARAAHVDPP